MYARCIGVHYALTTWDGRRASERASEREREREMHRPKHRGTSYYAFFSITRWSRLLSTSYALIYFSGGTGDNNFHLLSLPSHPANESTLNWNCRAHHFCRAFARVVSTSHVLFSFFISYFRERKNADASTIRKVSNQIQISQIESKKFYSNPYLQTFYKL